MRTRCKDGDLAIVIKDEGGCEANLGRFVRVHGPKEVDGLLGPVWLTTAITAGPLPLQNPFGRVERNNSSQAMRRPESWLLAIRIREPRPVSAKASGSNGNAGRSRK